MAQRISRKELKHDEFVDTAFDFGHWLEKHWKTVALWVAIVAIAAVAIFGWRAWSSHAQAKAQAELAGKVTAFVEADEAGRFDAATLDPLRETFAGLSGSGSAAGRLAAYYEAVTLHRLGRHDDAIAALVKIAVPNDPDDTLGASAQAMLARAQAAAGRMDEATATITAAIDAPESGLPTDQALLLLAEIRQAAGDADEARAVYQRIVDEYPTSPAINEARTKLGS